MAWLYNSSTKSGVVLRVIEERMFRIRQKVPTEVYLQHVKPLDYRGLGFGKEEVRGLLKANAASIMIPCNREGPLDSSRALKKARLRVEKLPNGQDEQPAWSVVAATNKGAEVCERLSKINTVHWLQEPWRVVGLEKDGASSEDGGWVLIEYFDGRSNKPIFVPSKNDFLQLKKNVEEAKKTHGYKEYKGLLDGRRFAMWDSSNDLKDWYHSNTMPHWASRVELQLRMASLVKGQDYHGVSPLRLALMRARHKVLGERRADIDHFVHTCFKFKFDVKRLK